MARKRVERLIKRYSRLAGILEAATPPLPLFRSRTRQKPGARGQSPNTWPGRLEPTQRLVLELLSYYTRGP